MTIASTAILRSVNGALLKAFDAWAAEFGTGAAASAFKMPSPIAEAIEADPELKEALFDWPVTLFVLDGGFGEWTVEKPPPGTLRRRSAKGTLWSGQEVFFLAVRENTQLTDCLLPQDFHLSAPAN
jgi:hypothetical protein